MSILLFTLRGASGARGPGTENSGDPKWVGRWDACESGSATISRTRSSRRCAMMFAPACLTDQYVTGFIALPCYAKVAAAWRGKVV